MSVFSANLGFLWSDLPLLERIDAAHHAGFEAIELHYPYATNPRDVRQLCQRLGIRLLGLNTAIDPSEGGHKGLAANPGRIHEFRTLFEQALDYVLAAGGTSIHVMSGSMVATKKESMDVLTENLRWAAPIADEHDIKLLIEPLNSDDAPNYALSDLRSTLEVLHGLNWPNVRLMFDAYHIQKMGHDPAEQFGHCLDRIGHIQIAGVPDRAEPLNTALDVRGFFGVVKTSGYLGHIGLEYRATGPIGAQKTALDAIWNRL